MYYKYFILIGLPLGFSFLNIKKRKKKQKVLKLKVVCTRKYLEDNFHAKINL